MSQGLSWSSSWSLDLSKLCGELGIEAICWRQRCPSSVSMCRTAFLFAASFEAFLLFLLSTQSCAKELVSWVIVGPRS